ncbi:CBS domain-containing protein [Streptomyces sp. ODS28]|uniref:CBS domain-containing protein n=1 Tax=Streptomyces sp. ODS28 TaxID=3136688 RepID=UPI0031ECD2FD
MEHTPHTVNDVMTHTVIAVGRHAAFKEIVRTMEQWKVSALPVLAGDGRVIGVVSEADLLHKEEFHDREPERIETNRRLAALGKSGGMTAWELMTAPAVCVHADAALPEAARIMALQEVKRLPVVNDEGALEGIVSRSDLLKVFLRGDDELAHEVREHLHRLFPGPLDPLDVTVEEGVVTVTGVVRDASFIPVAGRLIRGVEGVVGVHCRLAGAHDAAAAATARAAVAESTSASASDPGEGQEPKGT